MKIKSLDRLLEIADGRGISTLAVENQVQRIKSRLSIGRDEEGKPLLPYADGRDAVPLASAGRLLNEARFSVVPDHTGFSVRAEIAGQPAAILAYQDKKRNFLGWGRDDKEAAIRDLTEEIARALGRDLD